MELLAVLVVISLISAALFFFLFIFEIITKKDTKRALKGFGYSVLAAVVLFIVFGCISDSHEDTISDVVATETPITDSAEMEVEYVTQIEVKEEPAETETESVELETKKDYTELTVGDVAETSYYMIGLDYVKRDDHIPTATEYTDEAIEDGNELITAFFDIMKVERTLSFYDTDIQAYADGMSVNEAECTFYIVVDGYKVEHRYDILTDTNAIVPVPFIVPKGWKELKLFYGSDVIWTITQDDVSEEKYHRTYLVSNQHTYKDIPIGTNIAQSGYEVIYKGFQTYEYKNSILSGDYAVFKFQVNNTTGSEIDYSDAGYNMEAYHNSYSLGDASYSLDDQIDGCTNIFDINKIMPGMSANIYVAFNLDPVEPKGSFTCIFDDGYFETNTIGVVNTNVN